MSEKINNPPTSFQEVDVDADLTSFLEKPVPTQKRTFTEAFNEEVHSDDTDDEQLPASAKTKEEIYRVWTSVCNEKADEVLPLVEKVSRLSENQAKAYLQCLKAVNSQYIHKHLSSRLLTFFSNSVCHPDDRITPQAMEADPYLLNGISMLVSDGLTFFGRYALPMLLSAYAGTSWYYYKSVSRKNERESKRSRQDEGPSGGIVTSTVQTDGMREIADGENLSND